MTSKLFIKSTFLFFSLLIVYCGSNKKQNLQTTAEKDTITTKATSEILAFKTGAENYESYLPLLKSKKVGVVTNQTGIISFQEFFAIKNNTNTGSDKGVRVIQKSIVDFFIEKNINVQKIYAPEHGFRGTADAGELIIDGKDTKTGLPIISLYGNNKKPKVEQLKGIEVMVFDLQDVGARFYTYISSLHYVMEACAENNIKLIVLDRPNPNGELVDGPILEKEHKSFVGMHEIPVLHGMTIGEYAKMINGEKWLSNGIQCDLAVIPCGNYTHEMKYNLPVKPSPNLPNDQSINLYASLCFFEGTNVSLGRGTEKQFQIYGSPFLSKTVFNFSFTPQPNFGAKDPVHNGKFCFGEDLTKTKRVNRLELEWLLKAYQNTSDKTVFFNDFFTKLAGTKKLREQIEADLTEDAIRKTWTIGLEKFKGVRAKYLIYE
ncbi:exo-beta-N-acetylmuramidase NamZ domain-containing protein [Flavobacterium ardleyense]|uniref:Exo-beta-N-acetylmuramidase NamZ domain-containing protein n=1 Tax=Flavobacterium ardleyense TaxID=2038737 RepID=A0ABW5Z778_9FLAO